MESTLKQLRIRFTASTGLLAGVLLLLLSVVLCTSLFVSAEISTAGLMEAMLSDTGHRIGDSAGRRFFVFYHYDFDGSVLIEEDYRAQYESFGDDGAEIMQRALLNDGGKFDFDGMYFVSASREMGDGVTAYAVVERTTDREMLLFVVMLVVLIYITAVVVSVLFFYIYSARALAPVEDAFRKQRDLVANASHELKTPLTVISTNLTVMKSEPNSTVAENAKWMDAIEAQIQRMNGLIVSMLQLSKMENVAPQLVELDLSELTEGACLAFEVLCYEKGLSLVTSVAPDIRVMGDRDALERLVGCLLDNATKYCEKGGKIGVRLIADSSKAKLYVMNTGEPISEEDAAHVFDRFYRSDGARQNPDGVSFGLGLAIARATARAHGGTISCRGVKNSGTVFEVTIPLAKNQYRRRRNEAKQDPDKSDVLPPSPDAEGQGALPPASEEEKK